MTEVILFPSLGSWVDDPIVRSSLIEIISICLTIILSLMFVNRGQ